MESGAGKHWTEEEVKALLTVWSEKNIRKQLYGTLRNKGIFIYIAKRLQEKGIFRDWKQCRAKYKNLKYEYRTVKYAHNSGDISKTMKFFCELDAILHYEPVSQLTEDEDSSRYLATETQLDLSTTPENSKGEIPVTLEDDEDIPRDPLLFISHVGPMELGKPISIMDSSNNPTFIPSVANEGGKHWTINEVRALIGIWSDKNIQKQLEGTMRNKRIFEQIAAKLQKFGIDRDWKQCRTKYKNLKHEYKIVKNSQDLGTTRSMKFFTELDAILGHTTEQSQESKNKGRQGPTKQTDTKMEINNRVISGDVVEDSVSTKSEDLEAASIKGNHDKESVEGHNMGARPLNKRKAYDNELAPLPLKRSASDITMHQLHQSTTNQKDSTDNLCRQEMKHINLPQSASQVPVFPLATATTGEMATPEVLKIGKKLYEGKTKEVYELLDSPGKVLLQSKDQITAGNAARKNHLDGKAAISNKITSCIFELLQKAGIKTAFTKKCSETAFIAPQCEMIPIEWVCRRIATGSFLKRNPGVKEGYKFYPPKVEMFFKDDANNDPQWSEEQVIAAKWCFAGLNIGQTEVDIMSHSTQAIFEILEKSWLLLNCTLVDMKIEFGVDVTTKEIVLADVIDNDSWRLWPSGDRAQQKDKQSYRDLKEVTPEGLQMVKKNFEWVAERVELLHKVESSCRVVVLMGSTSDLGHCEKIKKACGNYGIPCELRVTSAHKGPDETLKIKAEYEGDGVPTVFVAVAGRSNGLGPVMSGNTAYPVINCPPLTPDWGAQDVWSSLRMPSGLGCSTILSPEGAAQFAAQIFGLNNHLVWAKLRGSILNTWVFLKQADKKIRECSL
ncbi:bifunctional phosphoribosylaminoimidazole carboxylase/phosphoribosylaminoimidazole succinocarboxamide synthetase isoform X1 [Notamacropus eugenii]|uniref:bifunctional phosphoribosylaminoimidazole carboxylase/phosphoribosylaminoimidazole succinocarboxamide synthetase isoform X1 n=2 Tax=Notamacropus eugenii TaxID=9315 RepID=UPI003B670504